MEADPQRRALLLGHVAQLTETLLSEQIRDPARPWLDGAFDAGGRTGVAATRLEGLLAALAVLPDRQRALRARAEAALDRGMAWLLGAQVETGPYAGAMPRAVCPPPPGVCPRRAGEVRIDTVQHALSAVLGYLAYRWPAP